MESDLAASPHEYPILRMIAVRVAKAAKENPTIQRVSEDLFSETYKLVKKASCYKPDMDAALAQSVVCTSFSFLKRQLFAQNRNCPFELYADSTRACSLNAPVKVEQGESEACPLDMLPDDEEGGAHPAEAAATSLDYEAVCAVIATLPIRQQKLLFMLRDGLNFEEMGAELGISASYAARQVKAACAQVRSRLSS